MGCIIVGSEETTSPKSILELENESESCTVILIVYESNILVW